MAKRKSDDGTQDDSSEANGATDSPSIGRVVHFVEKYPKRDDPGAPQTIDRAATISVVHDDPNPDELVDLHVLVPSGVVVVTNVPHLEPPAAEKGQPKPDGTPGTWHWPARV
jgi:hypothetical protein